MDKQLALLSETVDYLEIEQFQHELKQMKMALENRTCYISFVGRFSAGKSKLINNLLRMDLLPCGTVETTPVITYIRYGTPHAMIHYNSSETVNISIDELKVISQRSDARCEQIEYIDAFLENELLLNGLTIIDTPGLNTTIERHEKLFSEALLQSTKIVYVVGNAPSLVDINKLKLICENKCDFVITRTHCDEINVSEESFSQVVENDAAVFEEADFHNQCYYISNEPDSSYYSNIDLLREYLREIGKDASNQIRIAVQLKCRKLATNCIEYLTQKQELLNMQIEGKHEQLNQEKLAVEKAIAQLKRSITLCEAEIDAVSKRVSSELDGIVHSRIESSIKAGADSIRAAVPHKPYDSWMEQILHIRLIETIRSIRDVLRDYYAKNLQTIDLDMERLGFEMNVTQFSVPLEDTAMIPDSASQDMLSQISNRQAEIEAEVSAMSNSSEYMLLQQELIELEQELVQCSTECDEIPPYVPQMIAVEDGKMQPSQVARTIGNIADWATLFIPGGQVAGLLSKAGQSSKIVGGLAKVIGKSEKVCKIIKNGDTVKDIAFALKNMSNTYATQKRIAKAQKMIQTAAQTTKVVTEQARAIRESSNEPTVFDYLTISYWAGKIGEQFDKPPKYVVDMEYEREYQRVEAETRKRLADIKRKEYQKKCQMQLYATKQEQLLAEQQLLIEDKAKIEAEMQRQAVIIRTNAERKALSEWKENNAAMFAENLRTQAQTLLTQCKESLPLLLVSTKQQRLQELQSDMTTQEAMLSAIGSCDNSELVEQFEIVNRLIKDLKYYENAST